MTELISKDFTVRLADSAEDLRAAQNLRYEVFVHEMGGSGPMVDHGARLERDAFDAFADHLLLEDAHTGRVIGTYRMTRPERAAEAGGYYSADEFDLRVLEQSGRRLLELGRSCLLPEYRGGAAMHHLWQAVADYVDQHGIEILFGVASFTGTDINALAGPLSLVEDKYLATPDLRVTARGTKFSEMSLGALTDTERKQAMIQMPSLIKAYLRLGGRVGDGVFVDHAFNTTDICVVMDTAQLSARQSAILGKGSA